MTQTHDTCRGGRPSGARRPRAARMATRRTRVRVSSDAVVSAYIHDIARPRAGADPTLDLSECPVRDSNSPHRIKSPALYQMS